MPEQDAVLAIMGGLDPYDAPLPLNLVWDLLLPAMSTASLAAAPADAHRLREKVSRLTLLPVQGGASSPCASQVVGCTYAVDSNDLKIDTRALQVCASGWTVRLTTAGGDETICCGYAEWQPGQTTLFTDGWAVGPTPIVASRAWTADETFTMVVRLNETPFVHTLVFHVIGDELLIETWGHPSLEATHTLLLTAHVAALAG